MKALSQSVVARIELGTTSPSWDTLTRLIEAAGFAIDATVSIAPVGDTHVLSDVTRILSLSPEARLAEQVLLPDESAAEEDAFLMSGA